MQDRFKYKVLNTTTNKIYSNIDDLSKEEENAHFLLSQDGRIIKKYYNNDDLLLIEMSVYKPLFCTGYKDHCKTPVYDGDIVKVTYNSGQIPLFDRTYKEHPEPDIFYVRYSEEWQTYFCQSIKDSWLCPPLEHLSKTFEKQLYPNDADVNNRVTLGKAILVNDYNKFSQVIGNIYENPELLKEVQGE